MKKYFLTISVTLFCISIYAQPTITKPDTNQIKSKLMDFTRLSFKRTEVDSMLAFLSFPLYSKAWRSTKTYRSAKQLQKEQKEILMRTRFRQLAYTVESLHQIKNRKNAFIKNKNYTCFQMTVHLPEVGEAPGGSYQKTIFYVEKKKPYKIIGIVVEE